MGEDARGWSAWLMFKAGIAAARQHPWMPPGPEEDWTGRVVGNAQGHYMPPNNPTSPWMPSNVQPDYDMPGRFYSPEDVYGRLQNMPTQQSEHQPGDARTMQPPMSVEEVMRLLKSLPPMESAPMPPMPPQPPPMLGPGTGPGPEPLMRMDDFMAPMGPRPRAPMSPWPF